MLLSGLRNTPAIRKFQKPLPIIISNHMPPNTTDLTVNPNKLPIQGTTYVPLSAPIYEYSPFEFGSFDPQLSAFIPTEYLGTTLESGKPIDSLGGDYISLLSGVGNNCVRGFDQMSFIMGSTAAVEFCLKSTFFLVYRVEAHFGTVIPHMIPLVYFATTAQGFNTVFGSGKTDFPSKYSAVMNYFANNIGDTEPLMAHYPNPFKGVKGLMGFDRSNSDELLIVDGGKQKIAHACVISHY
jgi:lysophospholipase